MGGCPAESAFIIGLVVVVVVVVVAVVVVIVVAVFVVVVIVDKWQIFCDLATGNIEDFSPNVKSSSRSVSVTIAGWFLLLLL